MTRRNPRPPVVERLADWQRTQAARCGCRGTDDMCQCQNVDEPWKYGLGPARPVGEPVAWRVKDFADGWILCHTEAQARREAEGAGNLVQALYLKEGE